MVSSPFFKMDLTRSDIYIYGLSPPSKANGMNKKIQNKIMMRINISLTRYHNILCFFIDVFIFSCRNNLPQYAKVAQQTRKQLLMTNGLTDNLDVTKLLGKNLIKQRRNIQLEPKRIWRNRSVINVGYDVTCRTR